MFPITEFHFVFGGFAAVAATVGYQFARKHVSNMTVPKRSGHARAISSEKSDDRLIKPLVDHLRPDRRTSTPDAVSRAFSESEKSSDTREPGRLKRKNTEDDHYSHHEDTGDAEPDTINPAKKQNLTPPPIALEIERRILVDPVPTLKRKLDSEDFDNDIEHITPSSPKRRSRAPTPESAPLDPPKHETILSEPSGGTRPPTPVIPEEDEYVVVTAEEIAEGDSAPSDPEPGPTTVSAEPPVERPLTPTEPAVSREPTKTPELAALEPTPAERDSEALFRHALMMRRLTAASPKPTTSSDFNLRPSILGVIASPSPRPATPPFSQPVEFKTSSWSKTSSPFGASLGRTTSTPPLTGGGFAAFAGSASPFSTCPPFGTCTSESPSPFKRPIWSTDDDEHGRKPASARPGPVFAREATEPAEDSAKGSPEPTSVAHITGEEDEDLLAEVKGVRMYVKRGNNPFGGAMVGTLRHLVHKETQDERLLFRREPLWQPMLNVRLTPVLRCAYDAEELVLRILRLEATGGGVVHEPVLYALKGKLAEESGRATGAAAFRTFAEGVIQSRHLKATP